MVMQRTNPTMFLTILLIGAISLISMVATMQMQITRPILEQRIDHPTLPRLHDPIAPREAGHFTANDRLAQAHQARVMISDPNSQCDFYDCNGSVMRMCAATNEVGDVVYAMQWLLYSDGIWKEGSIWIQNDPGKMVRYMRNRGCIN